MGNPNQLTPPSSASGNNENQSESRRYSNHKKQQQFMAPTISTASKTITTLKKKNKKKMMILAEWKPPTPTKSAPKNPSFSEDETFVPDSTTVPYDPLINYLSPRPKFLRYNPNRKRKIAVRKPERGDSDYSSNSSSLTDSPSRVYLDCQSSCIVNGNEGNLEEEEDGVRWKVLLNWLVVIFGLVLSTVYISTMNNNMNIDMNSNCPVNFTEKLEVQDFGELSFGMVSLRGRWVFDEGDEFVMGVSEKFDAISEVSEKFDAVSEVSESFLQDHSEILRAVQKERDYGDELDEKKVEIEVPIAAQSRAILDPNLVTQEENLVDFEVRVPDLVSVVETAVEAPVSEIKGVESENEVKSLVLDAPIAEVRVPDLANVVELVAEVPELEMKGVESENEVKDAAENEIDGIRKVNIFEKEIRLPQLTYIWLVGLTVMCYVVCMMACLSWKCRRVFTRDGLSRKRLNPQAVREEQTRLVGQPPRVGLHPIHQMTDCIVNTSTLSKGVVPREDRQVSEMTTPRRIPTARAIGEVDFGGTFSGVMGRGRMQEEESVFTVPDERSAKRSKVSSSTSDYALQVDGEEEKLRRSTRVQEQLRSQGVASI